MNKCYLAKPNEVQPQWYVVDAKAQIVGRLATRSGISFLWATGDEARRCVDGAVEAGMDDDSACFFKSREELASVLRDELRKGDVVLVKASRAMRLERLFDEL